jgi:hypothetical protein
MLPDPRNIVVFAILMVVVFFALRHLWRNMRSNLQLIAELLQGEISYPILNLPLYFVVEGMYKGHKVVCYCNPLGGRRWHGDTEFSIEPHGGLYESSNSSLPEDDPTDVTYIAGNKIYCEEPISTAHQRSNLFKRANLFSPITRRDLISYLDRLTAAAEFVESKVSRSRTTA